MVDSCAAKTELWIELEHATRVICPVHNYCHHSDENINCLNCPFHRNNKPYHDYHPYTDRRHREYEQLLPQKTGPEKVTRSWCLVRGSILTMIEKLADCYVKHSQPRCQSSILDISALIDYTTIRYITIKYVHLKACHGAIWREGKGWVIFLRATDSPVEQKFTLLHELFHILLLTYAPSCQKYCYTPCAEILADHFALASLIPQGTYSVTKRGLAEYLSREMDDNRGVIQKRRKQGWDS